MNEWQDIDITTENTEAPSSFYIPYEDKDSALQNIRKKSFYFKSLNGNWNFIYYNKYLDIPDDIASAEAFNYDWSEISVPSPWQLFGYGDIVYSESRLEFADEFPTVPNENPAGVYSRAFIFPEKWDGKEIYINFDGVSSCFYLYINGLYIGYSEGSYINTSFNITKYLNNGENFITVKVLKYCTSSYSENTDGYRFSGILRDVYLLAREKNHVKDIKITADINGYVNISADKDISVSVYSPNGELIKQTSDMHFQIENPYLWTSETPNLYKIIIKTESEFIPFEIGFAEYNTENNFVVNNKRVKIKGVVFNEFDCDFGYYMTETQYISQLSLMKQNGINTLLCPNRPYSHMLAELCSEMGFYLIYPHQNSVLCERDKNFLCIVSGLKNLPDMPLWADETIAIEDESGNLSYSAGTEFEIVKGKNMLSGLTLNGIPKNELKTVCRSYRPIDIEFIDNTKIKIKNLNDFIKNINLKLEILCDGKILSEKNLTFEIAPKRSKTYNLNTSLPYSCVFGCYLNIYIGSFEYSFRLDVPKAKRIMPKEIHCLEAEQDKEQIVIFGNDFTYVFNTFYGCFTSFVKDGHEFITSTGFDMPKFERLHVYGYEVTECSDNKISLCVNYSISEESKPPRIKFAVRYRINANGCIDICCKDIEYKICTEKQCKFIKYFENGRFVSDTLKNAHSASVCRSAAHNSEYIFIHDKSERGIEIFGDVSFCTEKSADENTIYISAEKFTLNFNI